MSRRDDRAREGRVALLLEGTGAAAGDQTRQARPVEHALVEVERPLARLPRHQHPHQPLGEPGDDGAGGAQLGLEARVQLDELGAGGQRHRVHDAVVRRGVGAIAAGSSARVHLRAGARGVARRVAALAVLAERRLRAARVAALRQLAQSQIALGQRHVRRAVGRGLGRRDERAPHRRPRPRPRPQTPRRRRDGAPRSASRAASGRRQAPGDGGHERASFRAAPARRSAPRTPASAGRRRRARDAP